MCFSKVIISILEKTYINKIYWIFFILDLTQLLDTHNMALKLGYFVQSYTLKGKVEGPLVVLKTYVKTAYPDTDKEYEGISNIFILFKMYTNLAINI